MNEGDFTLDSLKCRSFQLQADIGDLTMKSSSVTDSTFSLSSGDAELSSVSFNNNCQITSKMGDIYLSVPAENLFSQTLSLKASIGDIDIPDELSKNLVSDHAENTSEKKTSSAPNYLSVKSGSGDITIEQS